MSNEAMRYQILGMLAEEGDEYVEIAKATEEHLYSYIKDYISDDDEKIRTTKSLGLSLAAIKFEDFYK